LTEDRQGRAQVLTAYLHALATLQQNEITYVNREIMQVIKEIEKELKLK